MGEKLDTRAGGHQRVGRNRPEKAQPARRQAGPTVSTSARRKWRRAVLAMLAILAVGIGAWAFWAQQRQWEEITLDLGNNVTMRLVLIPAGKFTMGSPDNEADRTADEGPQHEVTISKPFYMGVFEVTQEQYQQVMGTDPSYFKGATNPVETVSWLDAAEFCKKLSEKTGRRVTLPTEAQWEYACRAGTTTPFYTGDDLKPGRANARFPQTSPGAWEKAMDWIRKLLGAKAQAVSGRTTPEGSFPPSAFGLQDMHGNTWEWCSDWYGEDYYGNSPKTDPQGPATGQHRVLRGGCWSSYPGYCRSAFRGWIAVDGRGFNVGIGFRVVVSPGGEEER